MLAVVPDPRLRNPAQAVERGRRAVQLAPEDGPFWNTLGVAYYRAGDWAAAIERLEKAEALSPDKNLAINGCFLAMAHWRRGETEQARRWYDKAVAWMEKNPPRNEELYRNEELHRFHAEAAELLGLASPEIETKPVSHPTHPPS
ncbi:MAG: tetratricopeptide repeat protein [Isosphaeraceae bacterium]